MPRSDAAFETDVLIIGGGIAGAGAAYEISSFASVVVLERERQCGYHSTGRSAASFTENYGGSVVRRLAMASREFLECPPPGVADHGLLMPRGMMTIARADQLTLLDNALACAQSLVPTTTPIEVDDAIRRVPVLRRDYLAGAFLEPNSSEVDVNSLHQGFLKAAKARGARIVVNEGTEQIERAAGRWRVKTSSRTFNSSIIVNAAGAWADDVARQAGISPLGLVAKRRTAFNIPAPPGLDTAGWPLVNDVADEFYFKRDAGQLFVSPADDTPTAPADAHPNDIDIATGVERLERATTLNVPRVTRAWAGLRTFSPDQGPVVGPDGAAADFFWLAGQGGFGIKTSPSISRACASLIRTGRLPDDFRRLGIRLSDLLPDRLPHRRREQTSL